QSNRSFDQILADFGKFLATMAIKAAASQVFSYLFPQSTAGSAGPAAPNIFQVIGQALGFYATAASGGGKAVGGPVHPGLSYVVGEYGPERFVPSAAGEIQPWGSQTPMGDTNINVNVEGQRQKDSVKNSVEFARRLKAAVTDVIVTEKRPGGLLHMR